MVVPDGGTSPDRVAASAGDGDRGEASSGSVAGHTLGSSSSSPPPAAGGVALAVVQGLSAAAGTLDPAGAGEDGDMGRG